MSLLRLWLSIAIYQSLLKLTKGRLLNACTSPSSSEFVISCQRVDIDKVIHFVPPNITNLIISYSKQNDLLLPLQYYAPSLRSLALIDGELERIEVKSLFGLTHLEILILENNKLSRLEEGTLVGLNLQTLNLKNNRFLFLNDVVPALLHLRNMTFLDLSHNLFESLFFDEVEKLTNLTIDVVKLNDCHIRIVDPLVLSNWNIRELYISNNPVDNKCLRNISLGLQNSSVLRLEALMLSSLAFSFEETLILPLYDSKIQTLSIGENVFSFKLTFRSFFSLKHLQIVRSEISELDFGAVLTLPHLECLQLQDILITHLDYNKLTVNGSNLKTLDLKYITSPKSNVSAIPKNMFSFLSNLTKLTVEETLLGYIITTKTFMGLRNLVILTLKKCYLEEIEDGAFQDLRAVKVLSLKRNKLHSLRSDMFIGLSNLITLRLSNNLLDFLSGTSPFCHLTSLELLDLQDNKIQRLDPSFFANLIKLEIINLNNNQIVSWNVSVIPEDGRVSVLTIKSNRLNVVTPAMLKDFDELHLINLAANEFDCRDCNAQKFQEWILSTNVTLEDNEYKPYSCHFPQFLKGEPITKTKLDTEHCDKEANIFVVTITCSCIFFTIVMVGIISFKLRWHLRYCCYLLRSRVRRFKEIQDSFSYEYDAFVSYDPADRDWITHHLLARLETDSSRIKFCLHDRDCVAGNDIMEEIFEVVQKCRKTLLILSESYIHNQWCMFEMQMAQHSLFEDKRDSLILIQLHPIEEVISANLAYLITTRTYIVWIDHPVGQKLFWKRLVAALAKPDTLRMSWIV